MAGHESYRSARYEPVAQQRPQAAHMGRQAAPMPAYAGDDYDDEPAYAAAPMPMRRAPEPPPRPAARAAAPKPVPQPKAPPPPPPTVEELPSDEDLDKMLGPSRDEAAARAFGGGVARDDTTELDEEAIEHIPDPTPVKQIADEEEDLDDFADDIEPEDIPDPDPIPTVYGGADEDEDEDLDEGGSALSKLVAPAIAIVTVGVLVSGLILGRDFVVSMWAGANTYFYDYIGMHVMVPGDGLERKLVRTAVETVANVDHVIATGTVSNVSDKEQPVPTVLVQLLDAKVQVLEQKVVKVEKAALQPGETVQFRAVFEDAPATARTVRTEWGKFAEQAAN